LVSVDKEIKGMSGGSAIVRDARSNELGAFLAEIRAGTQGGSRGRLIFGLDATMSRQPTWDMAAGLQAEMFREVAATGNLDLQLVYYRGEGECKATGWMSDSARLAKIMSTINCRAGTTQIEKVLSHTARETSLLKVGAMAFVGDAMEENPDTLVARARELGRLKVPGFMFQEGRDPTVKSAFREIARSTGGAYGRFDSGAARQLSELLKAVALYAVGGTTALISRKDEASLLVLRQIKGGG
jgi:hypothetical protein